MKNTPYLNPYVDPNYTQYPIQPNVQPFQEEDTTPPSTDTMYQQSAFQSSPILSDGSYISTGKLDHKGNLHYIQVPRLLFLLAFITFLITIVFTVLFIIFRDYMTLFTFPCFAFGTVLFLSFVRIQKVTFDKQRRKMYGYHVFFGCFWRSIRYNIDFSDIKDIQCEIDHYVKVNGIDAGKRRK
jgi:hypothetical protein